MCAQFVEARCIFGPGLIVWFGGLVLGNYTLPSGVFPFWGTVLRPFWFLRDSRNCSTWNFPTLSTLSPEGVLVLGHRVRVTDRKFEELVPVY